jgi:FtsH-binding integral membrane protein
MYDRRNPQPPEPSQYPPQQPPPSGYPAQPYGQGAAVTGRTSLLDQVLGWLALSLLITTGAVFVFITTGFYLPWFVSLILLIGLIFGIQYAVRARNDVLAIGLFSIFAFAEGLFLGPVISLYLKVAPAAVGNAVLGTAGIFVFAAGVVWVTNRSFAAWGKWLLIALFVGILLLVAAIFIPAVGAFQILIDAFLGVIFVGLTIFDFWRVKAARPNDNNALLISLSLYLDFINIFLILLRIFGGGRRS